MCRTPRTTFFEKESLMDNRFEVMVGAGITMVGSGAAALLPPPVDSQRRHGASRFHPSSAAWSDG
jgi:hypothetical protein